MAETLVITLSIVLAFAMGFLIYTLVEVRKAATELREFLKSTSDKLDVTLAEADEAIKSARAVTDNINDVAHNVRNISSRLSDTAQGVKNVATLIGGTGAKTRLSTVALGAGIRAAFEVFSRRLALKKEGGSHG